MSEGIETPKTGENIAPRVDKVAVLKRWMESGKYLPPIIRDFHDQKDLFKTIHWHCNAHKCSYLENISWVAAQVYVVDFFLWFMAKHGYTLQKTRSGPESFNLQATIDARKAEETQQFQSFLTPTPPQKPPQHQG